MVQLTKSVTAVLCAAALCVQAQTAEQIINSHIAATGGAEKWKSLNSVILKGRVRLGLKEEYPIQIYQQRPDLKKTVVTIFGKATPVEGYDGKKGYAMNYATNKLQVYPSYVPEDFDSDLLIWNKLGFHAELLGKENVEQTECYKIQLTKNKNKTNYYIDTKNYQLLKEEKPDETLYYSEFKKIGGLVFPFRITGESKKKDGDYVLQLQSVETNIALPKNTFTF